MQGGIFLFHFFFFSLFDCILFQKNNGTFLHTCDTPKHVPRDSVLRTWQRRSKGDGAASLQVALHLHCRPYNSNRPTTYCSIFSNSHNQSILLISNIFLGITSYNIYRAFGKPFCQTLSRLPELSTLPQPVEHIEGHVFSLLALMLKMLLTAITICKLIYSTSVSKKKRSERPKAGSTGQCPRQN